VWKQRFFFTHNASFCLRTVTRVANPRPGTLVLETFTYTLTFAGFGSPYITITASDP